MSPEEEAIFERAQAMKRDAKQVIAHSQSTRKQLGGSLIEHFKFLLVMGPTELDKEIKSRFEAWDTDKGGSLNREEMQVGPGGGCGTPEIGARCPLPSDASAQCKLSKHIPGSLTCPDQMVFILRPCSGTACNGGDGQKAV
jgi:hypothetical protein